MTHPYKFDNLDNGIYLMQLLVKEQIVQTQKKVYQKKEFHQNTLL